MEDYDEFLVPAELLISVFCLIFKRYLIILFWGFKMLEENQDFPRLPVVVTNFFALVCLS